MKFFTDFLTARENSEKKDLSILLLVFGVAFFQFLGRIPLVDPDEGRYAENTARDARARRLHHPHAQLCQVL